MYVYRVVVGVELIHELLRKLIFCYFYYSGTH